jgi:mRNA interferase YafQ
MKILKQTSQFKKDLKRIQNNHRKIESLGAVLEILEAGKLPPQEYNPHMLVGNYKGYMECHVENDLLLIWFDESEELIKLIRLGSHSELFK